MVRLNLNELPLHVLVKIFSYLPIREMVRIKLVCKLWQELAGCVRYKSLSLCQPNSESKKLDKYFLRRRLRYEKDFDLYLNDLEKFSKSTGRIVSSVQRLMACLPGSSLDYVSIRFVESYLNGFKSLEELELTVLGPLFGFVHFFKLVLNLERLRKLFVRFYQIAFELNCPELCHLDVWDLKNYQICHPEKLRTLMAMARLDEEEDIGKFVNLKNLIIRSNYEFTNPIRRRFVERLPKNLKLLVFFPFELERAPFWDDRNLEDYFCDHYPIDSVDQEGSSLRVFCFGIEIDLAQLTGPERERFPKNYFNAKSLTEFLLTSLVKSVDANACFHCIQYEMIESRLPTFEQLYRKIYSDHPYCTVNLEDYVADQARLFAFIDRVKPAKLCFMDKAIFPRSFYDSLVGICSSSLKYISFDASDLGSEPDQFDFLFKMTQLECIMIENCNLAISQCLDFVIAAFENLENLETFRFDAWFYIDAGIFLRIVWPCIEQNGTGCYTILRLSFYYELEGKEVDILKYLNAKLKHRCGQMATNEKLDRRDYQIQLFFLTHELERQLRINLFVPRMVLNYTKATPIYLGSPN